VQFCIERAMTNPVGRRQGSVEDGDGAIDIACMGFDLGQRNFQ
jgi:hypothetical protein